MTQYACGCPPGSRIAQGGRSVLLCFRLAICLAALVQLYHGVSRSVFLFCVCSVSSGPQIVDLDKMRIRPLAAGIGVLICCLLAAQPGMHTIAHVTCTSVNMPVQMAALVTNRHLMGMCRWIASLPLTIRSEAT